MTKYFLVEPQVAGGWGERTVATRIPGKPEVIQRLHYEFNGRPSDELLEGIGGGLIATERMAREIEQAGLSGAAFDEVEVTVSEEFAFHYPNLQLPNYVWLKVVGTAGRDDFGVGPLLRPVVSDRALDVLRRVGFAHASSVKPFG
jgi:hypothetical protein